MLGALVRGFQDMFNPTTTATPAATSAAAKAPSVAARRGGSERECGGRGAAGGHHRGVGSGGDSDADTECSGQGRPQARAAGCVDGFRRRRTGAASGTSLLGEVGRRRAAGARAAR